ncbi:unnamed protein product [Microthlaspi erraticum]|uniref:Uncharacterized protein n=1 Tax=Microthlaspi erraticum TaxID=1685480 RepID=A0A6D2KWF0_9BRAS|nr:unnamed protein product [Microthlaspi erraticum]
MDIKFCKTNLSLSTRSWMGVGHEDDLREEEPELDRAEDRAESQAEDQSRRVRIWVSLSAIILRSMRLQG